MNIDRFKIVQRLRWFDVLVMLVLAGVVLAGALASGTILLDLASRSVSPALP